MEVHIITNEVSLFFKKNQNPIQPPDLSTTSQKIQGLGDRLNDTMVFRGGFST